MCGVDVRELQSGEDEEEGHVAQLYCSAALVVPERIPAVMVVP